MGVDVHGSMCLCVRVCVYERACGDVYSIVYNVTHVHTSSSCVAAEAHWHLSNLAISLSCRHKTYISFECAGDIQTYHVNNILLFGEQTLIYPGTI